MSAKERLPAVSYDAQLAWLENQVRVWRANAEVLRVVLSVAESVKTARDHALNCPVKR